MPLRHTSFLVGAIASTVAASCAHAAMLSVNPAKDNTLVYNLAPAGQLSNGAGQHIFAGRTNQDSTFETGTVSLRRGLVAFDVSAIPSGSTVNSVTLTMFQDRAPDTRTFSISVHKLLADWGEGTSNTGGTGSGGGGGMGAPATQDDATWLYRFYDAAAPAASPGWATAGGDFVADASATTSIVGSQGTPLPYSWSGAGVVADVQAWVDDPSANFGWLARGIENGGGGTVRRFESRQNDNNGIPAGEIDARPLLTIDFTPVPEPTAIALLSAVTIVLVRRRSSH